MALVVNDRVKETSTTTGTGTLSLAGAVSGFQTFVAGIANSNTTFYCIVNDSGTEFEIGIGTVTDASPDTLSRDTILESSNSDSAVNFSSGTKTVFCTLPASKAVFEDASSDVTLPNDLILGSDSAVLKFGADSDINITHVADTGLTTNGDFSVGDDLTVLGGVIEFKSNSGSPASLKMYCESSNAHFQTLQPQPHSASAANTLRLPNSGDSGTQDLVAVDITQTLTNKTLTTPTINGATIGSANLATASDGDINIAPDGTGKVVIRGNDNQGKIVLNCEANTHGQTIIAAPHSESADNVLTLPSTGGNARLVSTSSTATLTNKTLTTPVIAEIDSGSTITLDATTDIVLDADGGDVFFKDGGTTIATLSNTSSDFVITTGVQDKDFIIKGDDGGSGITALTIDMSAAGAATFNDKIVATELDISGNVDVDGTLEADAITVNGTALNTVIAGVTVTNATTAAVATTVTISDNESTNEDNAIIFTAGGDVDGGNIGLESDGDLTYNPSTGRLTATQLAGTLQTAAQANITSLGTLTTLTVDNVIINGTTIGHTDDTDLITVADGIATVAGEISVTTLDIGGTNVAATAAELNIMDGGTAASSTTVADADRVVFNDNGTMKQVAMTDISTYTDAGATALAIALG